MRSAHRLACWIAASTVAATAVRAQEARRVVVVQIAGANLYLDAGSDAGVRAGDTLAVRRAAGAEAGAGAEPVGTFAVLGATPTRCVVAFVGAPFPVTRGDTLYLAVRPAAVAPPQASPMAAAPRAAPPVAMAVATRSRGAVTFEVSGARTTTLGLGADPLRSTQDFATPAMRLRWGLESPGAGTSVSLNLLASHRAGPEGLFDPQTSVRIYEARVDRDWGRSARLSFGRFLSSFDHASGYWDGAMLRVGGTGGLAGGVAAGFEPVRTNEQFSADRPKYAAFVNYRSSPRAVRYGFDLAFHQLLPRDSSSLKQTRFDWSQRLDLGGVHLRNELEAGPAAVAGRWAVSRFQLRASAALGPGTDLYGTLLSDQPVSFDTTFAPAAIRRERASIGLSHRARRFYADLDVAVNSPRVSTRGYAAGLTFAAPDLVGRATLGGTVSVFTLPAGRGLVASPSVEYRFGELRARAGYQLYLNQGDRYLVRTHGGDLLVTRSLTDRADFVTRLNFRYGANLRSLAAYTGLEVRF